MSAEFENNKINAINAVKQNIRVINSIVLLVVATLLLINVRFLSSILDYIPFNSVVILLAVVSGCIMGIIYLVKTIYSTAIKKLEEYGERIDILLVAKQKEINDRKTAEDNLRKAHDGLEIKVNERTVELSETVTALKEEIIEREHAERLIQLQLNRLDVLHSIETSINSSHDLRSTLDHIVSQVTTQLGVDAVTILLLNQHMQVLEYVVSRGFRSSALKNTRLKLGESNAGRAAIERRIVSISDLLQEPGGFARSKLFSDEEFISYFAVPLIANGEVKGVLELFHRATLGIEPKWLDYIDTIANQAAIAIDRATILEKLQQSNIELKLAYDTTIEGWSHALDLRDKGTEGHSRRVTEMTLHIAQIMGIEDAELVHIRRGALLHDIGKMGIPDSILLKPGKLDNEEWEIMKHHTEYAYNMLHQIEYLRPSLDIPYCHHERWDGTGYPKGLRGEQIPLAARIFAIADVWDALCSDRPYSAAWPKERAFEHICSNTCTHFDPQLIEIFKDKAVIGLDKIMANVR